MLMVIVAQGGDDGEPWRAVRRGEDGQGYAQGGGCRQGQGARTRRAAGKRLGERKMRGFRCARPGRAALVDDDGVQVS